MLLTSILKLIVVISSVALVRCAEDAVMLAIKHACYRDTQTEMSFAWYRDLIQTGTYKASEHVDPEPPCIEALWNGILTGLVRSISVPITEPSKADINRIRHRCGELAKLMKLPKNFQFFIDPEWHYVVRKGWSSFVKSPVDSLEDGVTRSGNPIKIRHQVAVWLESFKIWSDFKSIMRKYEVKEVNIRRVETKKLLEMAPELLRKFQKTNARPNMLIKTKTTPILNEFDSMLIESFLAQSGARYVDIRTLGVLHCKAILMRLSQDNYRADVLDFYVTSPEILSAIKQRLDARQGQRFLIYVVIRNVDVMRFSDEYLQIVRLLKAIRENHGRDRFAPMGVSFFSEHGTYLPIDLDAESQIQRSK